MFNITNQNTNSAIIAKRKRALLRKFTLLQQMNTGRSGNISITGSDACTNGVFTRLPIGDFEDPEYLDMLEGMIDHENGHYKHTDFKVGIEYAHNKFISVLSNVFEDIRIEKLVGDEYPGARQNLEKLVRVIIKKGYFPFITEEHSLAVKIQMFFLYYGRYHFLHQYTIKSHSDKASELLMKSLPNVFSKLLDVAKRSGSQLGSQDGYDLALEVVEILRQEQQDQNDNQSGDSSDDNQSGDSSDDNQSGDSSDDNQTGDSSDDNQTGDSSDDNQSGDSSDDNQTGDSSDDNQSGDSSDDNQTGDSSDDNQTGDSSDDNQTGDSSDDNQSGDSSDDNQTGDSSDDNQTGDSSDDNQTDNSKSSDEKDKSGYSLNACSDDIQSALDADEDELICDLHKKIRELMEEKAEEFEQKFVEEFDAPYFAPALPFTCKKSANASGIPDWVTEARMNSQRIKTVLHSILYDRNKSKRSFDKQGTDLCSGAIWGVKAGNSRIFRTDAITRAPNSAFTILVDKSGSMGSSDMRTANVAAYSIAQALEFLKGTECEVLYYPFGSHDEPHNHVAKAFNERMASVTSTSFNVHANGGTPTAEALLGAVTNLIQRKEERKIIFLITDGDTAGPNVKAALQECDVLGITVIGIGIKTGELSGFENRPTMLIDQCADLAPAMFNFLRDYYQA